MVLALLCVAQVVVVLDATIVAIALPSIQHDLGMTAVELGWVVTAYTLAFGGCLLGGGRWADRVGRRRAFAVGLAVFGVASLACGLAPSGGFLLAARAVQGLGAAVVAPAALALLTSTFTDGRARSRALAWWTAAAAGGGASGWVLGGLITAAAGWRWVFLVTVPVCVAVAALAPRRLPGHAGARRGPLDLAGIALVTAGLAALVLGLGLLADAGPTAAAAALAAAAVLLVAFWAVERRSTNPLLDSALLRRPGVAGANTVAAVLTGTTTPVMLLCTLHAQDVLGLPPSAAGLLFPPFNVAVVAGSLAGPWVLARIGGATAMAAGLGAIACGAVALTAIATDAAALPSMLAGFVLMGAGLGVASVASTAAGTAPLDADRRGVGAGLLTSTAQIGTALGLAAVMPLTQLRTQALGSGAAARVEGFELGFLVSAAGAALAAAVLVPLTRRRTRTEHSSTHDRAPR